MIARAKVKKQLFSANKMTKFKKLSSSKSWFNYHQVCLGREFSAFVAILLIVSIANLPYLYGQQQSEPFEHNSSALLAPLSSEQAASNHHHHHHQHHDRAAGTERRPEKRATANTDNQQQRQHQRQTIWDFGASSASYNKASTWPTLGPKFALEPNSFVEYSNSTGTVIACRPQQQQQQQQQQQTFSASSYSELLQQQQQQQQQQQSARSQTPDQARRAGQSSSAHVTGSPISISWRQVRQLPDVDEELQPTADNLRFVRQDGSLVFAPFKAHLFRPEIHAATYRCCLSNRLGSICSRPVRTRAVVDTSFNVEVFDEIALAGNSVALRCQVPVHARPHLDFIGWLKDDKLIASSVPQLTEDTRPRRRIIKPVVGSMHTLLVSDEQTQRKKYLMLQTGELFIRNVSKLDAAAYKCRVRNRLTGVISTSKISGQLMVDESQLKSELRLIRAAPIIWAHENADVYICAHVQSFPVAKFTWFRQQQADTNKEANSRQLVGLSELAMPEVRQFDSCLLIHQVQQHHAGSYICEADNGESRLKITSTLIVASSQLTAQLQVGQPQALVRDGGSQTLLMGSNQRNSPSIALMNSQSIGQQTIVQLGTSVHLNCSIVGFPYDTIAWFKDDKLFAAASVNHLNLSESSSIKTLTPTVYPSQANVNLLQPTVILIENFELKDRGIYQCQAYLAQTKSVNNISHLLPAHLSSQLTTGDSMPREWRTNELETSAERDLMRSASSSVQLDVPFSRPVLSQKFQSQIVQRGSSLSLQCSATGLPVPRIVWLLDGMLISSSTGFSFDQPIWPKRSSPSFGFSVDNSEIGFDRSLFYTSEESKDWPEGEGISTGNSQASGSELFEGALESSGPPGASFRNSQLAHQVLTIEEERFQMSSYVTNGLSHGQPMTVSVLNVSRLATTESGQYKCLAFNPLGSTQHSAQISVPGNLELRSYQPTNVTIIAGRTASLQCPLIGYPLSRVDWFRNDQRLPTNHRQRVEPVKQVGGGGGGQLELSNVDKTADGGLYTCRASLQTNGSSSEAGNGQLGEDYEGLVGQVRAIVRVAPLIDTQSLPEIVQANEGMRVKLVCSVVQGDHPIEIRWLKRASDRNKVTLVGRTHLIGFELMQNSPDIGVNDKDDTAATSAAQQQEDSITIHNLEDSCLLTFKQISYMDSADYLCLAQNEVSQSMRLARVIVNVAPSWSSEPANEMSVLLGGRLQIDCLTHGFPTPSVTWKRETSMGNRQASAWMFEQQQPLLQEQISSVVGGDQQQQQQQQQQRQAPEYSDILSNHRQRAYINGTLIVDQVDQMDAAAYMCEVANGVGTGLSKVIRVRVNVPPHFRHRSASQLSQFGAKVELKCVAFGDQPMVVGWRKDNDIVDLVNDSRHRLVSEHRIGPQAFESILTIELLNRNDSGQYVCIASNEFGTEDTRIQLVVQEAPEAPVLMRPIRTNARSATLTFRPPYSGNSLIRKYAIAFKPMLALEPLEQQTSGGSSNNNNNNSSQNQQQTTKDHQINWQQMLLDAPPISANNFGDQKQDTFSASAMSSNESNVISSSATLSQNDLAVASLGNQLVSLNLCCLQPFTRYTVRVRAINDIGQSEPSKAEQFVTDEEAIGGPPLDVGVEATGAHSLKVRWRAPAKNLQNGFIRGYYIGYRAKSNASNASSGSSQLDFVGSQLMQQQSSPNIKVFESNNLDGEQFQYKNIQLDLNPLSFRPGVGAPFTPLFGHSSETLGLHESGSINSIGASANQLQQQYGGLQVPQVPQVFTSYLTNLRRKTAYAIIVQAYNKIGTGPRSDQIVVSTLDAAPPMSPILRLLSVTYNEAQLTWSARKFVHESINASSQPRLAFQHTNRVYALEESPMDEEDDDDPHSYYTINFRTEDRSSSVSISVGGGNSNNNNNAIVGTNANSNTDTEWQQKRIQKRQPIPYMLSNLRCGSQHSAFMTATNSLGQSEPGETIRFATMGAAPIAPQSSRDFLHVNSTYVILRLSGWQNAGCIISSFVLRYKATNQAKWTVLEHQVHPTIQTVTVSGSAVFSTRPLNGANAADSSSSTPFDSPAGSSEQLSALNMHDINVASGGPFARAAPIAAPQFVNKRQVINDFIIRNLLATSTYQLFVEANSEAGSTNAEYEFETTNFSSTTVAINVNGIVASIENGIVQRGATNNKGRTGLESLESSDELDFSYSGNQRAQNGPFQRYTMGVWSLTALLVIVSIFMATATLVLGLRSLFRMKPLGNSRDSLASALFCCSNSASSSASNADSSHSSLGAGTCYQASEHPMMDAYCTGRPQAHHHQHQHQHASQLMHPIHGPSGLQNGDLATPTHAALADARLHQLFATNTISGHVDSCERAEGGELKAITGNNALPFRQLAPSTSLSIIGDRPLGQHQQQQLANGSRHTHTLSSATHCQAQMRRLSGEESVMQNANFRSQFAATLGKHQQHSSFVQNSQPVKYNSSTIQSPLYGRLQAKSQNLQEMQQHCFAQNNNNHSFHPAQQLSSSIGTSGYETGSSIKMNNSDALNYNQPIYLQSVNSYQQQQQQQQQNQIQMNQLYGDTASVNQIAESNLYGTNVSREREINELSQQQRGQNQGQFHYGFLQSLASSAAEEANKAQNYQQSFADEADQLAFGMMFGSQQQQQTVDKQLESIQTNGIQSEQQEFQELELLKSQNQLQI